jgi:hemerythrin
MIKWTPSLAVGHAVIDAQHQELFRRLDALLGAMTKGDQAEVGRLFDFLASYVVEHFGAEERLMRETGYPDYAVHKAAHDRFVAEYGELRRVYDAGGGGAPLAIRLQNWAGDWLKAHIAGTDQALARHLAQRVA